MVLGAALTLSTACAGPEPWGMLGPWVRSDARVSSSVRSLSAATANEHVRAGALFVDVRTEDDRKHSVEEPSGAVALPFTHRDPPSQFLTSMLDLVSDDRSRPIVLICPGGERSRWAAWALVDDGFLNVFTVFGGLDGPAGWVASGLPIKR